MLSQKCLFLAPMGRPQVVHGVTVYKCPSVSLVVLPVQWALPFTYLPIDSHLQECKRPANQILPAVLSADNQLWYASVWYGMWRDHPFPLGWSRLKHEKECGVCVLVYPCAEALSMLTQWPSFELELKSFVILQFFFLFFLFFISL